MREASQRLGELELVEVIRNAVPGDIAINWKVKPDLRVELSIQARQGAETTTLQFSHPETKDFLTRLMTERRLRVTRLEQAGDKVQADVGPAFPSSKALGPEDAQTWKDIAREASKRYPTVAADVIFRKMYGLYRQALDKGETPKREVLLMRIDRHMSNTFARIEQEAPIAAPVTVLAVHTVKVLRQGTTYPAKLVITGHERGALSGEIDCPGVARCAFTWGTQLLPQTEDAACTELAHSAAYHLAGVAWSNDRYSRKAACRPNQAVLRPHVRRPSIGRSATVVNGRLADPETQKCLRAEAELFNKASRLIPGTARLKAAERPNEPMML